MAELDIIDFCNFNNWLCQFKRQVRIVSAEICSEIVFIAIIVVLHMLWIVHLVSAPSPKVYAGDMMAE